MAIQSHFFAAPQTNYSIGDLAAGFLGSAFSASTVEMFGFDPLPGVEGFRADNPGLGLASEFAGFAVPYAGWWKATNMALKGSRALRTLEPFAKFTEKTRTLAGRPILGGALSEVIRYSPVEAVRIGGSLLSANPQQIGDQIADSVITSAFTGVLGGAGGLIGAAGTLRNQAPVPFPEGIDQRLSAPQQLRQLNELMEKGALRDPTQGPYWKTKLEQAVLAESPLIQDYGKAPVYIKTVGDPKLSKTINRLFQPKGGSRFIRTPITPRAGGFTEQEVQDILTRAGLQGRLHEVQFPRLLRAKNDSGAKALLAHIAGSSKAEGMLPVRAGSVYMHREADDGLFIGAKRIKWGNPKKKAAEGDEWIVFKTDNPQLIDKQLGRYAQMKMAYNNFMYPHTVLKEIGDSFYDGALDLAKRFELHNFRDEGPGAGTIASMLERINPSTFSRPEDHALAVRLQRVFREYFAPSAHEFSHSARATRIWSLARMIKESMDETVNNVLYGKPKLRGDSILATILAPKENPGPHMRDLFYALTDEDLAKYTEVDLKLAGGIMDLKGLEKMFTSGQISDRLYKVLLASKQHNDEMITRFNAVAKETGNQPLPYLPGHLGYARTWVGNSRVVVFDETKAPVFIAGGRTAAEASKVADDFIAQVGKSGYTKSDPVLSSYQQDIDALVRGNMDQTIVRAQNNELAVLLMQRKGKRPPSARGIIQAAPRTGMGGYVGHQKPPTKEELFQIWESHHRRLGDSVAEMTIKHQLHGEMLKLGQEHPDYHRILGDRISQLFGNQGSLAQLTNRAADRIFGGVLGKNSATKIASAINSAQFHLQLGALNTMYPLLNVVGIFQTAMPQVAFLLNAPPTQLAKFYTAFAAPGTSGAPKRAVHTLDTFRVMRQGFRDLANPDAELKKTFEALLEAGEIEPRFVEEYLGQRSLTAERIKDAFSSPGNFAEGLRVISEFMPGASERFARSFSAVIGHRIGKDFFKLQGEDLIHFARQVVQHSNYLYTAVDRPKLLTGPIGSFFGLFKTWMMNNVAWSMEYAGLGLKHGEWAPLLYSLAGTGTIGGVAAIPGYGLANWLTKAMTGETVVEHLNDGWFADVPTVGNSLMYGLPAALGVSLQGSAAAPGATPLRDANMFFSLAHMDRLQALTQVVGGSIDRFTLTGEDPFKSHEVRDAFIRATTPRSVQRVVQTLQGDAIRSLHSGYPYVEVPVKDRILYGLGFNPVTVEKFHDIHSELWTNQNKLRKSISEFGQALAQAWESGDDQAATRIYNRAVAAGVPIDSVLSSAQTRLDKSRSLAIERSFSPAASEEALRLLGERP